MTLVKRTRSENWIKDDKNLLKELIRDRIHDIENKNTDTNTNTSKKRAWREILESFNSFCKGSQRTVSQLKSQWGVIKLLKKKEISLYKRDSSKTSGGLLPPNRDNGDSTSWLPEKKSTDINSYDSEKLEKDSVSILIKEEIDTEAIKNIEPQSNVNNLETNIAEDIGISNSDNKHEKLKRQKEDHYSSIVADKNKLISALEIKYKEELYRLQIANEKKKRENIDLKSEILREKLLYYKKKNITLAKSMNVQNS